MRSAWTLFTAALLTIIFASIATIFGILDGRGRIVNICARTWARLLLTVNGVRVTTVGLKHLNRDNSYVFMPNHSSALDIPVLFVALPFQIRMIAKKELFRIPVFGWALALGGYIRVDRENREKAIASLKTGARRIVQQGASAVIFPEGTRSFTGELGQFKKGGFMFAFDTSYPVVPVTINGSRGCTPNRQLVIFPGRVEVMIGEPIPVDGYTVETRGELIEKTYRTVQANQI